MNSRPPPLPKQPRPPATPQPAAPQPPSVPGQTVMPQQAVPQQELSPGQQPSPPPHSQHPNDQRQQVQHMHAGQAVPPAPPPLPGIEPHAPQTAGRGGRRRAGSPAEHLQPTQPPKPPGKSKGRVKRRRLSPFFRFINGLLTLSLLLIAGTGIAALTVRHKFAEPGPLSQDSLVTIPRGRGLNAIAAHLERKGVVTNRRLFVANVIYKRAQSKLKAGQYHIPQKASIEDVVDRLVAGKAVLYKVTLPEGQTSLQIVNRLNGASNLTGELTQVPREGSLLPDTYVFSNGMARSDLLDRMRRDQQKILDLLWETRQDSLPLKSKEEALILASIVEKETGRASERARVAAVFVNRLRKGMKLQSDPTIIYGLVGGKGRLGHPIRRSELNKKTPYNTYQIPRLPPTPICNPGRAAIAAVLNPANTNELYFVADGTGGHVFAATLKQHNANVRQWRLIEKQMRKRRAQPKKRTKASLPGATRASQNSNAVVAETPTSTRAAAAVVAGAGIAVSGERGGAAIRASRPAFKIINRAAALSAASDLRIPLPVRNPRRRSLTR